MNLKKCKKHVNSLSFSRFDDLDVRNFAKAGKQLINGEKFTVFEVYDRASSL